MNDQGIIPEYEEKWNTRLVTTSTWDEFAFFAGEARRHRLDGGVRDPAARGGNRRRHRDVRLVQQPPSARRSFAPYSDYETLEDLQGRRWRSGFRCRPRSCGACSSRIGTGPISAWSAPTGATAPTTTCDEGDHFVNMDLLLRARSRHASASRRRVPVLADRRGEVRCTTRPPPVAALRGKVRTRSQGPEREQLRGTQGLVRETPERGRVLARPVGTGDQGMGGEQAEIIRSIRSTSRWRNEADIDFAVEYMEEHDFFTDTVYLDEEWVENETADLRPDEGDGMDGPGRRDPRVHGRRAERAG